MKEYLKMADVFGDIAVKVRDGNGRHVMCEDILAANCFCTDSANHIAHAINSHDELVAAVERLRESLKWAVGNLPFENAFEWSDDENADAHYAALRLLGVEIDE